MKLRNTKDFDKKISKVSGMVSSLDDESKYGVKIQVRKYGSIAISPLNKRHSQWKNFRNRGQSKENTAI